MDNSLEAKRPGNEAIPELDDPRKKQLEAAEFANAKEAEAGVKRDWSTEKEQKSLQAGTDEIARIGAKETPIPEFESNKKETETGLDKKVHDELVENPTEWVNKSIGNKELSAHQKMLGVIELSEDLKKKE